MAYENFDYQGFLRDLGYPEDQIPQEMTDEQKEQVFTMAAHSTYKAYADAEQAMFPMLDKKQARRQAMDRLLADVPMFREPLGIPQEITDKEEPYRLENFEQFIKATYPGQTNLDELAENYIESYTDFIYKDSLYYKRPFLRDVDKRDFAKHFKAANNIDKEVTVDDVFRTVDAAKRPRQITPHYAAGELKKLEGWKGNFRKALDDLMPFWGTSQWRKSYHELQLLLGEFFDSDYLKQQGFYGSVAYAERERQQNYVPHYTKGFSEAYNDIVTETAMKAALEDPNANRGWFGSLGVLDRLKMLWRMTTELTPLLGEAAVSNAAPTLGILTTDILTKGAIAGLASGGMGTGVGTAAGFLSGVRKVAQFLNKSRVLSSVPGVGASALFMLPEAANEARELGLYREEDAGKALLAGGAITFLEYLGAMASVGFGTWGNRLGSEGARTFWRNFMGEFPDITKMTFAKNAWKQNLKLAAGTAGNVIGDASAEGLTEGIQKAVSMAFSESLGAQYTWEDYVVEGLGDYFAGTLMSGPISATGTLGRGVRRAYIQRQAEKAEAKLRRQLQEQGENIESFSENIRNNIARAVFKDANGNDVYLVSGGAAIGRGANTRDALINTISNVNARRGENVNVDADTIISDSNNPNTASIQYGNSTVTYNSVNGDAVKKLQNLVREHNDGENSFFTFNEGTTITEVRNPLNPSQISYEVKFSGEPQPRGVFSNLYHPAVLDRNFGNFALNTQIITSDDARTNRLRIEVPVVNENRSLNDVEYSNFDNQNRGYTILGKEEGELVLFDGSRGIVFTVRDDGDYKVSLSARTIYGRNLRVPENLREQDKRTGITVDAEYGIGAQQITDSEGKQVWGFNLDELESELGQDGITLNRLDRSVTFSQHVEATTPSGKTLSIDVDASNGNIFPVYQGQLLYSPRENTRAFEISDTSSFPSQLEPHRANFGSWEVDNRPVSRASTFAGHTAFLKTFTREDGLKFYYDIVLDSKGNLVNRGRFDFEFPTLTWSSLKNTLRTVVLGNDRRYEGRIQEGYVITTDEGTPRYYLLTNYNPLANKTEWGGWTEDLDKLLNVFPIGAEQALLDKIEQLSTDTSSREYLEGVQIFAQRFVRLTTPNAETVNVKKLLGAGEDSLVQSLGITPQDILNILTENEIRTLNNIANDSYRMMNLTPDIQAGIRFLVEGQQQQQQRQQQRQQQQPQQQPRQQRQQQTQSNRVTLFDDSDTIYDEDDVLWNKGEISQPLQSKSPRQREYEEIEKTLEDIRQRFDNAYNDITSTPKDLLDAQKQLMLEYQGEVVNKIKRLTREKQENAVPMSLRYRMLNFIMMAKIGRVLTRLGRDNFSTYTLETRNIIVGGPRKKRGDAFTSYKSIYYWDGTEYIPLAGVQAADNLIDFFDKNEGYFTNEKYFVSVANKEDTRWINFRTRMNQNAESGGHFEHHVRLAIIYRIKKDGKLVKSFIVSEPALESPNSDVAVLQKIIQNGAQINRDIENWFWGKEGEITKEIRNRLSRQTDFEGKSRLSLREDDFILALMENNLDIFNSIYPWIKKDMGINLDGEDSQESRTEKILKALIIYKPDSPILEMPVSEKLDPGTKKGVGEGILEAPIYTNEKYTDLLNEILRKADIQDIQETYGRLTVNLYNEIKKQLIYLGVLNDENNIIPTNFNWSEDGVYALSYTINSNISETPEFTLEEFFSNIMGRIFDKYGIVGKRTYSLTFGKPEENIVGVRIEDSIYSNGFSINLLDANSVLNFFISLNAIRIGRNWDGRTIEAQEVETEEVEAQEVEAQEVEAQEVETEEVETEEVEAQEVEAQEVETEEVETEEVEAQEVEAKEVQPQRQTTKRKQKQKKTLGDRFFDRLIAMTNQGDILPTELKKRLKERLGNFLSTIQNDDLELLENSSNIGSLDIEYIFAYYVSDSNNNLSIDHYLGKKVRKKHQQLRGEVKQSDIYRLPLTSSPEEIRELREMGYLPQLTFVSRIGRTEKIFRDPLDYLNSLRAINNIVGNPALDTNNIFPYLSYNIRPRIRQGYHNFFSQSTDSMSPASFRTIPLEFELKDAYGDEQIDSWLESGHLVIIPDQASAASLLGESSELVMSSDGYIQGFYDGLTNTIYFVEDGIADGEAHKVMVHERGLHANRLGLRNTEDFQALLRYIESHRGDDTAEGQLIRDSYNELADFIPEEHRTEEALGKILDSLAEASYNIFQRFINAIKRFLYQHGWMDVNRFTINDMVMMARIASRANIKDTMLRNGIYYSYVGSEPLEENQRADIENEIQEMFHASPYRFDEFDTSFMSAGEGNQAHGWGIYVGKNKDWLDNQYRVRLLDPNRVRYADPYGAFLEKSEKYEPWIFEDDGGSIYNLEDSELERALDILYETRDIEETVNKLEYNKDENGEEIISEERLSEIIDYIRNFREAEVGQLYRVEVPSDNFLLEEDANLHEQSKYVKEKLKRIIEKYSSDIEEILFSQFNKNYSTEEILKSLSGENYTNIKGWEIYGTLTTALGDKKSASEVMLKEGIKGISYIGEIDGEAKVIFSEDDVVIVETYYSRRENSENRELANIEKEAVREFGVNVLNAVNIIGTQNEAETLIARLREQGTGAQRTTSNVSSDIFYRVDPNNIYSVSPRGTRTKIQRDERYGVGKRVGRKVYFHSSYAGLIVPADILQNALSIANQQGFRHNTMMYDESTGAVRFDECRDFDIAREPSPGRMLTVYPDGRTTQSKTEQIFHHKWLWVSPGYAGFSTAESQAWSATWLKANEGKGAPSGYRKQWNAKLRNIGLENYVENEDGDISIRFSREGLIQGFYANGQIYLVRDGIAVGQTVPVLMHEIGEHAAQLGFLEDAEYEAILDSLRRRRDKDSDVQRAIERALQAGEEEADPTFWREVSAYLVEEHGKSTSGLLGRILNFFKKVLFRMGIINADRFTTDDLAQFAYSATRAWIGKSTPGRTAQDIFFSRQSSPRGVTDVDVKGLDTQTAKSKQLYGYVQENRDKILNQNRTSRLDYLREQVISLETTNPQFYMQMDRTRGVVSQFIDAILRSDVDVFVNPNIQRVLTETKVFLNDVIASITQSTPDKVARDSSITLEDLRAVANAIEGEEFTRMEENAGNQEEVTTMRTNRNIVQSLSVPQAQSFLDYTLDKTRAIVDAANSLFQYTPIQNADGSITPALSDSTGAIVARFDGLSPYDAPLAIEHLMLKTRVGEGRKPSDVEQPDPFFYEKLKLQAKMPGNFDRTVALLDENFITGVINSLPQHIKAKIHIHRDKNNPMTRRLLVDTNSYGIFVPLVPDPVLRGKTIHIRAFDISPEEFIKTVSEEVGHFSWQLLATPEMTFVMDDMFEMFQDAIIGEISDYLTDAERQGNFGARGENVFRKTVLLNELFSKNAVNIMDKRYDGRAFEKYGITQESLRKLRNDITSSVRNNIAVKMNTALFSSFFEREGQPTEDTATHEDFSEFFTNYFIALMSPAMGKSVIYSLPNLAGGETQIKLNDWGQIRRTIPPSREAQIRAEIKEIYDMQESDFMKGLVIWRYDNLPFNLHLNWLRKLLPKKYHWISMPHGRLGDTVIGADISVMLARAFQALNDDSGLLRKRQFTEAIEFANYLRANNLDPDLIDSAKGYVKFMEENELKNEKMLKLAEEFDKILGMGEEQINNNVLRIQDEFMKTIEALEVWGQRMGLDWKTVEDMKKDVSKVARRFRTDYTHRTYRAFSDEDRANLLEMRRYLEETDPDQFISTKAQIASNEINRLRNMYHQGQITSLKELRKRLEPHQHILNIYKRLNGLRTYAEGIIDGKYTKWRDDPDAVAFITSFHESSVHGRMLAVINGILNHNMEAKRKKKNAEIEHSKFSLISGVLGNGRLSREDPYESGYMDFLDEVKNPVENLLLSLDQQNKVIAKIAFNRILGEKILSYGMGRFRTGIEGEMLSGIEKIAKYEDGTFLAFIKLDEFFNAAFEREYDIISNAYNTWNLPFLDYYKALRANLTIYNPKLISSNYFSNISILAVSGHLLNIANVFKGMPVIAESWMRQIAGKSKSTSDFVNQILQEMQENQVFGGSSSSTEMRTYSHNTNEKFLFFFVEHLKKAHVLSKQREFQWKTWIEKVYETAREVYGYGDEWVKVIAYINNRAVQMAKFESELDPTDLNFQENVRQAAAKEAADITKLETTTWELTPMFVRRMSGANFRLLTSDFIMHNFQILRMTAAWVGRFIEASKEYFRLASLPEKTEAQQKYQTLVGQEAARRLIGLALGSGVAGLIMLGPTYPMSLLLSGLLGIFRGDGDDDKEFEEGEIRGLTAAEREGAQMMLNSVMSGENMWAPFAKTGKYTFLATNDPRQHAALSLMSPAVPSENPALWERLKRMQTQIMPLAQDNILGETYNALRGRDRYGQDVGYWKTGWNTISRFIVPEAANQIVFTGDALWSWATGGELKGRTVNDIVMGYERKQTLGQMSFSLVGAGVREYDVRDTITSMGYQMKQFTANNTNYRRRDFIQKVICNPGASDSTIASDIADMMAFNRRIMDKSLYNVRGARTWGSTDKEIATYFSHGRNAPDTSVMSVADAEKLLKSENIYDNHIVSALERQRDLFSTKFGDDSKYTREQRAEIVRNIDRYLQMYKVAMGEGKYQPQNSKSSRRSESSRPTGKSRYNRLSVGDGRTRIVNVIDGDTFDVVGPRGEQYRVRLADVDAYERGQGGAGWESGARISELINRARDIEVIPRYTDKYGRVVAEIYLDGVNLSSSLLRGGYGVLYDRYARNVDVLNMVRRGEARANSSAMNPQEYRRQQQQ